MKIHPSQWQCLIPLYHVEQQMQPNKRTWTFLKLQRYSHIAIASYTNVYTHLCMYVYLCACNFMYEQYMDVKYVMYLEWNTYLIGQVKGMEYIH